MPHRILALSSLLEAFTGLALMVQPAWVIRLLSGEALADTGLAVGRLAGFSLIALGYACWPWQDASLPAMRAMLIYNTLAVIYFIYLKVRGEFTGILLLPVIAAHGMLALLFAQACWNHHRAVRDRT